MKIIILDDMPERHEGFKAIFWGQEHELVHCWTYSEFIEALLNKGPFGMACLDHDLGDNPDIEPDIDYGMYGNHAMDGRDVCRFLRGNSAYCPKQILIHSWNPNGAREMRDILSEIPGIKVTVRAFGQ